MGLFRTLLKGGGREAEGDVVGEDAPGPRVDRAHDRAGDARLRAREVETFRGDLDKLERRVRDLEGAEQRREADVTGFIQRLNALARRLVRAGQNQELSAGGAPNGPDPNGAATPAPPRGLRGARLRIYLRKHGLQGRAERPEADSRTALGSEGGDMDVEPLASSPAERNGD